MDEVTTHESTYDLPANPLGKTRGLYEVSSEVDRDVRAQYQSDEANHLKKQVSSLKACQLCQSTAHTAASCPNMSQVQAAQEYTDGEARYVKDAYRNPNPAYQQRTSAYQDAQPYRPPGYQAPYHAQVQAPVHAPRSDMDELRRLMVDLHKASDQRMDSNMRKIKANIKGINVHSDDLETWKRGVDSQLRHLASAIPGAGSTGTGVSTWLSWTTCGFSCISLPLLNVTATM